MPSILCEPLPTGQYTSYEVYVLYAFAAASFTLTSSVAFAPGWISGVRRSMPWPSISNACGTLPAFVTWKLTGPAGTSAGTSFTDHSDSRTSTTVAARGRAASR